MTLYDLYLRIIGTTGLDVIDLNSLRACIHNCFADLTSRGYKLFKELHLKDFATVTFDYDFEEIENPTSFQQLTAQKYDEEESKNKLYNENQIVKIFSHTETNESTGKETEVYKYFIVKKVNEQVSGIEHDGNWMCMKLPNDIRKITYVRLFLGENATVATRVPLTDKRIQCKFKNGRFRSKLDEWEAIFYTLNDKLYIEWNTILGEEVYEMSFGYYQKLSTPEFSIDPNDSDKMKNVTLDIRPEFADALVLYAAYFYTNRYLKDADKVNLALSNYKYYIEDIVHELSYEDEYNEEDAVIKIEEDD